MQLKMQHYTPAVAGLSLLWLIGVMLGLRQVHQYENQPGTPAFTPTRLPHEVAVNEFMNNLRHGSGNSLTLVMIVHPRCPCSRASLVELAQLMARSQGRLHAAVVFVRYGGVSAHWVQTDTWRQAAAIPGVQVLCDDNGVLARRFGAFTSGQTFLYDPQGRLLFSGGLTSERGQEGDNAGLSTALALLRGQTPNQTRTPVFGCPLFPFQQSSFPAIRHEEKIRSCRSSNPS